MDMETLRFKIPALLLFIFCSVALHAQTVVINVEGGGAFCGFSIENGYYSRNSPSQYITREAKSGDRSGIPDVVAKINRAIGIDVRIYIYIAEDEHNCFASIGPNGKRILIADHLFLNEVNQNAGTEWAAISIIAHEIGHHIAGFTRRASKLDSELDADYWSGYALQKLGASEEASVKCMMVYGTEHNSSSHPNKYSRVATIKKGWRDALNGTFDKDRCESCD